MKNDSATPRPDTCESAAETKAIRRRTMNTPR